MKKTKRILFPGAFDPFTVGHQALVARALHLVDDIIIAIGVNTKKKSYFSLEKRIKLIETVYKDHPEVKVTSYETLTSDFAVKINADFILRGVRTIEDFEYEKNMADVNRKLTGIDTVLLFAEPQYSYISSAIVRELLTFGKDISNFVPDSFKFIMTDEK